MSVSFGVCCVQGECRLAKEMMGSLRRLVFGDGGRYGRRNARQRGGWGPDS